MIYTQNALVFPKSSIQATPAHRSSRQFHFSDCESITARAQQGSILIPHLFVIVMIDIFLNAEKPNLCNFVDDITPYTADKSLSVLTDNLKKDFLIFLIGFMTVK